MSRLKETRTRREATEHSQAESQAESPVIVPALQESPRKRTRWVAWVVFAGVVAVMVGFMQAITGFLALFNDGYYVVTRGGFATPISYTAWGWIHLAIGLSLVGVGTGLLLGTTWARILAVAIA